MKRKCLGVLFTVLFLFSLVGCSAGISGTFYEVTGDSAKNFSGYDADTYFEFKDGKFTYFDDGEEQVGVINKDNGSLIIGNKTLTYKLADNILTVSDGETTKKFLNEDSSLFVKVDEKQRLKDIVKKYEVAKSNMVDRVCSDIHQKMAGTYKNDKIELLLKESTYSYKTSDSSDFSRAKSYIWSILVSELPYDEDSSNKVEEGEETISAINDIKTWEDYREYTGNNDVYFSYGGNKLDDSELHFVYDEKKGSLELVKPEENESQGELYSLIGGDGATLTRE